MLSARLPLGALGVVQPELTSIFVRRYGGTSVNPLTDPQSDERQERFLRLFLPEQGGIRAFIRATVWDRARCDDLFQEVALVLWRELDRYEPERPFGAWARGIAAKTVLKSYRDAKRAPVALSPEAIVAVDAAFERLSHGGEAQSSLS